MSRGDGRRLPRRIVQLIVGVFLYGIGISFIVRGQIGAAPWDVLTQGIANHVPLSFGVITVLVSIVVLLLWIPIRQRLGIGTVVNALLVGPSADVGFLLVPESEELWLRIVYFVVGLIVLAGATGLYIGGRFGPGPRDGLMTGLHDRLGWPIWLVRTALEVTVVAVGWLLGGNVGIGTLAFALLVGPLCQFFLRVFDVRLPDSAASSVSVGTGEVPLGR
ncbi:hypothetical protein [Microbacterium sp.]|uniref:membrane protein YczE n=1 Tax=Microbacterium sp. TaxID=51671 RepID=UPI0033425B96